MKKKIEKIFVIFIMFMMIIMCLSTKKSYAIESTYQGFDVVGNLEIPKISLDLPIISKVTSVSITLSAAYLYGVGINQIGNSVIVGRNYRNNTLFSNVPKLVEGDYIKITDMQDNVVNYRVYKAGLVNADDSSYFNRDTNGKREINLITAGDNSNDNQHFVVWAAETTDEIDDSNKNDNVENITDNENKPINNNVNNNISNTYKENNIISNNNITTNNDTSVAKTVLPKTGINLMIILFFIVVIACTIVSFIKFEEYKKIQK